MSVLGRVAFSFVVDVDPRFAYQGWHLANSILEYTDTKPSDIHIQFTPEVGVTTKSIFLDAGFNTHLLTRFGDGRFCNKIAQWDALGSLDADHFIFLDTDVILVSNILDQLSPDVVSAKIVDLANPSLEVLDEIVAASGLPLVSTICPVDAGLENTYIGNCNGGMYSVPRRSAKILFPVWRRWAAWLLDNQGPLKKVNRTDHIDQVSFYLAVNEKELPFELASSNTNYYIHFPGDHNYFDPSKPISMLHYHHNSMNVLGLIESEGVVTPQEVEAVAIANAQIGKNFCDRLFWEFRYRHFSERGSGVGSRGANAEYKVQLLRSQGIEHAESVLDVGCGDLFVMKSLSLKKYFGVDQSPIALKIAKEARPDWEFLDAPAENAPASRFVVCFEVLIHQKTLESYLFIINYLTRKSKNVLIVSGYEDNSHSIANNQMLFFHEPLSKSLKATGRFKSIVPIGHHTDVTILRCEIASGPDS